MCEKQSDGFITPLTTTTTSKYKGVVDSEDSKYQQQCTCSINRTKVQVV